MYVFALLFGVAVGRLTASQEPTSSPMTYANAPSVHLQKARAIVSSRNGTTQCQ